MLGSNTVALILILVVLAQAGLLFHVYGPGGELDIQEELRQIKIAKPEDLSEKELQKLIMAECSLVPHTLDGTSLQPAFKNGTSHVFFEGEPCPIKQMIKKNSVVLLRTGASVVPIAKFVKALPGDKLEFDRRAGRINVLTVNGKDVTNSAGQLYSVPRGKDTLLQRYIEQYKGVVPINAYLLLGDNPRGSLDSTKLGLVHVSDMEGVMRDNPYEGKEDFAVVPKAPVARAPVPATVSTDAPDPNPPIPEEVIQNLLPKNPAGIQGMQGLPEGFAPPLPDGEAPPVMEGGVPAAVSAPVEAAVETVERSVVTKEEVIDLQPEEAVLEEVTIQESP